MRACSWDEVIGEVNVRLGSSRSEAIHFAALCVFGRSSVLYPIGHGQMTAFEGTAID